MASIRRPMQEDEVDSVGSGGMGGIHLNQNGAAASSSSALKANIHLRESATLASLAHQNEQMLQARLQRAQQALDDDDAKLYAQPNQMAAASSSAAAAAAAAEDTDDDNELAEMEDANPEDPVGADELHEHALASGYYDAVPAAIPAAAAAAGGRGRFFPPAAAPAAAPAAVAAAGRAISLEDVAKAMIADDVKPEDAARWKLEGLKLKTAIDAVRAIGSHFSKDGQIVRMAEDVPAFAMKRDRSIILPDSVSVAGLTEREQSANTQAALLGTYLSRAVKLLGQAEEQLYKVAVANHTLRHHRKKFAAQKSIREAEEAEKALKYALQAQHNMQKNPAYQQRQLQQADKRQKVGTSEGKKIDRFAEEE